MGEYLDRFRLSFVDPGREMTAWDYEKLKQEFWGEAMSVINPFDYDISSIVLNRPIKGYLEGIYEGSYNDLDKCLDGQKLNWKILNGNNKIIEGSYCHIIPPFIDILEFYPFLKTVRKKFLHFQTETKSYHQKKSRRVLIETYLNQHEIHYYCPQLYKLVQQKSIIFLDTKRAITNLEYQAMIEIGEDINTYMR